MKFITLLSLASVFTALNLAMAGNEGGNGGGAVVCRDSKGTITSAELLDLYEGRVLHHLNIPILPNASEILQAKEKSSRLIFGAYDYWTYVKTALAQTWNLNMTPPKTTLTYIDDAAYLQYPEGCKIEQLGIYTEDFGILVKPEIYNALDATNKAAFHVHEAVYKVERDVFGAKNSANARAVVAYLFSDHVFDNKVWQKFSGPKRGRYRDDDTSLFSRVNFSFSKAKKVFDSLPNTLPSEVSGRWNMIGWMIGTDDGMNLFDTAGIGKQFKEYTGKDYILRRELEFSTFFAKENIYIDGKYKESSQEIRAALETDLGSVRFSRPWSRGEIDQYSCKLYSRNLMLCSMTIDTNWLNNWLNSGRNNQMLAYKRID